MIDVLLEWLGRYGYPVVFLAAMLENLFPVGFLVPGEIVVLSAAAGASAASLDPVVIAVLALIGETAGEVGSYYLGRTSGARLLAGLTQRFPRLAQPLAEGTEYFRRHGAWAIVLGRPAWGVKATMPVIAGMTGMPPGKTIALVFVSSLYYYPSLVALAYLLGLSLTELRGTARTASIVGAIALVVVVTVLRVAAIRRRTQANRVG